MNQPRIDIRDSATTTILRTETKITTITTVNSHLTVSSSQQENILPSFIQEEDIMTESTILLKKKLLKGPLYPINFTTMARYTFTRHQTTY